MNLSIQRAYLSSQFKNEIYDIYKIYLTRNKAISSTLLELANKVSPTRHVTISSSKG